MEPLQWLMQTVLQSIPENSRQFQKEMYLLERNVGHDKNEGCTRQINNSTRHICFSFFFFLVCVSTNKNFSKANTSHGNKSEKHLVLWGNEQTESLRSKGTDSSHLSMYSFRWGGGLEEKKVLCRLLKMKKMDDPLAEGKEHDWNMLMFSNNTIGTEIILCIVW